MARPTRLRGGKRFTAAQLADLEAKLGVALPADFRAFLADPGTGGPVPGWYRVPEAYRRCAAWHDLPDYLHVFEIVAGRKLFRPKPARGGGTAVARADDAPTYLQIGATEFDKLLLATAGGRDGGVWLVDRDSLPVETAVADGNLCPVAASFAAFADGFEYPPALAGWYPCVIDDDVAALRAWVAGGGDPDKTGDYPGHVLCFAIEQRKAKVVRYLLDTGCAVNRKVKEHAGVCDFDLKTGTWTR